MAYVGTVPMRLMFFYFMHHMFPQQLTYIMRVELFIREHGNVVSIILNNILMY